MSYRILNYLILISLILHVFTTAIAINSELLKRQVIHVVIDNSIDGGTASFIEEISREVSREVIILIELDSYGGYLAAADRISRSLLGTECYVWIPPGAKAASAAAMIALSCRKIFMGIGSVIGAASPIPRDEKTLEYVTSRFKALAQRLFDNKSLIDMVEAMVRYNRSFTFYEAVNLGLANEANSIDEVLEDIGGYIVSVRYLGIWHKLISILSDPVFSSLLLGIGVLLIFMEIFTTGFQGYVIAGVLLIIMALYGMSIIPPDLFALSIFLIGLILLSIETMTPGFGMFGLTGIALASIGIVLLIKLRPLILPIETTAVIVTCFTGITGFILYIMYRATQTIRMKKPRIEEMLIGSIGIAKTSFDEMTPGVVYVLNEDWTAYSLEGKIDAGCKVKVIKVEGLKLYVVKVDKDS